MPAGVVVEEEREDEGQSEGMGAEEAAADAAKVLTEVLGVKMEVVGENGEIGTEGDESRASEISKSEWEAAVEDMVHEKNTGI